MTDTDPDYLNSICRGSLTLGTACGVCEKCEHEKIAMCSGTPIPPVESPRQDGISVRIPETKLEAQVMILVAEEWIRANSGD